MRQYGLLNAYRGIEVVKAADKPLFLVDFLCMSDDIAAAKKVLDRNPELAKASRLCYLVQNNIEFVFLFSRYQTSITQEINGMSALHVKSIDGDIEQIIAFLALECNINAVDYLGNTAMHYCASHDHFDCLEILIRLGGNRSMVNRDGISTDDILAAKNIILDINDVDVELTEAIFQLLEHSENLWYYLSIVRRIRYNKSHTIVKKNRFTITSLLNLPHKIDYTEAMIHKISQVKEIGLETHSPCKTLELFMKYVRNV
ncbi:Nuclear factor NF-kappa-B p105 subunit [Ordospora colligata]